MNHESQLRVSGRLLSVAIIIASVLMIATALSWFRSQMQSQDDARRALIHRDLQNRYREFYVGTSDSPTPASSVSFHGNSVISKPVPRSDVAVSHSQTFESSTGSASGFVSFERSAPMSNGSPSVTVPVTIHVNNGELLSELLQARQEVSNLQQLRHASSSVTSKDETSEAAFSYVVHDGQNSRHNVSRSGDSPATSLPSHPVVEPQKPAIVAEKQPLQTSVSPPVPDKVSTESVVVPAPTEPFELFESAEPSPASEKSVPMESGDSEGTRSEKSHVDNFVPPDATRVMAMSYQSVSVVAETSDPEPEEESPTDDDDAMPFLEFAAESPGGISVPEPPQKPLTGPLEFETTNEPQAPPLLVVPPLQELQSIEPAVVSSPIPDRRTQLSNAFLAIRGLPPEKLFDDVSTEPAIPELALISIPASDEIVVPEVLQEEPFQSISIPVAIDMTVPEADRIVQTATTSKPQTAVPPIPDIAFSESKTAADSNLHSSDLQIPSSLEPLDIAGRDLPHTGVLETDDFTEPNDIFRLPDESEFAADPTLDRALKIAQSPAPAEHFDTRTSDQLVPLPPTPLTIPEMVDSPPQQSMPEFMPPASMPSRPVYRSRDPKASTMSLAVRRFKKRMAQVTGSIGASMPEVDRPDFELADIPLPGIFGSQGGQTQRAPQRHTPPLPLARRDNPQQPAPNKSRPAGSWLAMPQLSMPELQIPQFALPQMPLPGFRTAQQDCEHCDSDDAGPTAVQRLTESTGVHRAMSTIRFVGQSKTVR